MPKNSEPPWLLLDVNYLCYRAYFAIPKLSYNEIATSVVFGFLKELLQLQETFATTRVVFCFDVGKPLRRLSCPSYKASRDEGSEEDQQARAEVREQTKQLRKDYLPSLGFKNILWAKGYEADDLICSVCETIPKPGRSIIVSGDKDLFQLLAPRCNLWIPGKSGQPGKLITEDVLRTTYGVSPESWVQVKAMAGCPTDEIPGIPGVGEKTAAKFLRGELSKGKKFEAIVKNNKLWRKNLSLVRLPYGGCPTFDLVEDKVTSKKWDKLIERLGMTSLASSMPSLKRRSGAVTGFGLFKRNKHG